MALLLFTQIQQVIIMSLHFQLLLISIVLGALFTKPVTVCDITTKKERPEGASYITFAGGIIYPAGGTACLRYKADAIRSIDLKTGKIRWESNEAFLPLAAEGNLIAALGLSKDKNTPVVVLFDLKGKLLRQSGVLPGNVWFAEGPASGSTITTQAESGVLIVHWYSQKHPFSGVPNIAEQRTVAFGELQVDLETGKVKIVRDEVVLPGYKEPVPPPDTGETEPELKLPAKVSGDLAALHSEGWWPQSEKDGKPRPMIINHKFVLVIFDATPDGRKLILRSWNRESGKAHAPVTLVEGKGLYVISAQGEFLFVEDNAGPTEIEERPVWIFSLDSGKEIARLTYAQAMLPLCVSGDRLLRITGTVGERMLESVCLRNGKSAWSCTFYKYYYSGPYPP
jgi:hypothetical protein